MIKKAIKKIIFILFLFLIISNFQKTIAVENTYDLSFMSSEELTLDQKKLKLKAIIDKIRLKIQALVEKRKAEITLQNNQNNNVREEHETKNVEIKNEVNIEPEEPLYIDDITDEDFNNNLLQVISESLSLRAKSYGVYLFNPNIKTNSFYSDTKKLFAKNRYQVYPLASLTKTMTSIIAWENIDHNAFVKMTSRALAQYGDNKFRVGERFTLYDAIVFMMTISSNDLAYAISDRHGHDSFIDLMNSKAQVLGMEGAYFETVSGLDRPSGTSRADAGVEDVAKMLRYFYRNFPLLSARTVKRYNLIKSNRKTYELFNTKRLLREYKNFKFWKTGTEASAGGNLSTIYKIDNDNYIIIVVLGSTASKRYTDTEKVIRATRKYIKEKR